MHSSAFDSKCSCSYVDAPHASFIILCSILPIISQGDSLQNLSNGLDTISYRVPLGVCAGIGKRELSSLLSSSMSLLFMLSSHSKFLNFAIYLVSYYPLLVNY